MRKRSASISGPTKITVHRKKTPRNSIDELEEEVEENNKKLRRVSSTEEEEQEEEEEVHLEDEEKDKKRNGDVRLAAPELEGFFVVLGFVGRFDGDGVG